MSDMPKPMPVPGNWKNARTASNSAKPAMICANSASPWLECPKAAGREKPDDSGADREPAPEPDAFEGREVAEGPEPVEAEHSQAKEQEAEPREGGEKAEDRDQDGRVLQGCVSFWAVLRYTSSTTPEIIQNSPICSTGTIVRLAHPGR